MKFQDAIRKLKERFSIHHYDPSSGPILVTEGHGVVAYRVVARLLAAGYPSVRVGVPDPQSMGDMAEGGASIVEFNWDKEYTFAKALEGVKTVFCVMPHHENWEKQFNSFLDACRVAGVKNFVKLSFYHALTSQAETMRNFATATSADDPFLKVPLVQMHRACDEKLIKSSSFEYCILFASHFMSNPLVYQTESLRKEGRFIGASAGKGVNYVSPNDVADVAVRALLAPKDHYRVGYTLTGPSAVKDEEVAQLIGQHLNKTVTYVDMPIDKFVDAAKDTDWGPSTDVIYLEHAKASGAEEQVGFVHKDIERICGHPAETFEEYLLAQDFMSPQELAYLKP